MKKILIIFFSLILVLTIFNKQILKVIFKYKLSQWVEKDIIIKNIDINYSGQISMDGIQILNVKKNNYKNIFEAEKIIIQFNLNSLLSKRLIIINNLYIEKPTFYLDIVEKVIKNENNQNQIFFEDNLGLAEKMYKNIKDRIWPKKIVDLNFLIIRSKISNPMSYIKLSTFSEETEVQMSNFEFFRVGNSGGGQHFKDVLKIIFFDIIARIDNFELRKSIEQIYQL